MGSTRQEEGQLKGDHIDHHHANEHNSCVQLSHEVGS